MWRETGPKRTCVCVCVCVCVWKREREMSVYVCVSVCVYVWGVGTRMLSESFQVTLLGARQSLPDFWFCHLSLDCTRWNCQYFAPGEIA